MIEQERETTRAIALLDGSEARGGLALLQAKVVNWAKLYESVAQFLSRARSAERQLEGMVAELRVDIVANKDEFASVMDVDAGLTLGDERTAAGVRFQDSLASKKSLGFE